MASRARGTWESQHWKKNGRSPSLQTLNTASASAAVQTPGKNPRGPEKGAALLCGPGPRPHSRLSSFQKPLWIGTCSARQRPAPQFQTHVQPEGAAGGWWPTEQRERGERENMPMALLVPAATWCERRRGGLSQSKRDTERSGAIPRQKHAVPLQRPPNLPEGCTAPSLSGNVHTTNHAAERRTILNTTSPRTDPRGGRS